MSQLATAKKSGPFGAGENARSEMPSPGGSLSGTSDLRSPTVVVAAELAAAEEKRPDIVCFFEPGFDG